MTDRENGYFGTELTAKQIKTARRKARYIFANPTLIPEVPDHNEKPGFNDGRRRF